MTTKRQERLAKSDRKLTKSEWNEVLWGEKKPRAVKYGRTVRITKRSK